MPHALCLFCGQKVSLGTVGSTEVRITQSTFGAHTKCVESQIQKTAAICIPVVSPLVSVYPLNHGLGAIYIKSLTFKA
jgi:hypothetical protein